MSNARQRAEKNPKFTRRSGQSSRREQGISGDKKLRPKMSQGRTQFIRRRAGVRVHVCGELVMRGGNDSAATVIHVKLHQTVGHTHAGLARSDKEQENLCQENDGLQNNKFDSGDSNPMQKRRARHSTPEQGMERRTRAQNPSPPAGLLPPPCLI